MVPSVIYIVATPPEPGRRASAPSARNTRTSNDEPRVRYYTSPREGDRRGSVGMMSIGEMHDVLDSISRQSAYPSANRRRSLPSRTALTSVESCACGDPPYGLRLVDDQETSRQMMKRRIFTYRWTSSATVPSVKKGTLGSRRRPTR